MKYNRLFLAGMLPASTIKEIKGIQGEISRIKPNIRLTNLKNIHLTIIYMGNTESHDAKKIIEIISRIVDNYKTIYVSVRRILILPISGKPRVVSIELSSEKLNDFKNELYKNFSKNNLLKDKVSKFIPHITIARLNGNVDNEKIINISKIKLSKISFRIKNIKLINSELKQDGPKYSTIEKWQLQN